MLPSMHECMFPKQMIYYNATWMLELGAAFSGGVHHAAMNNHAVIQRITPQSRRLFICLLCCLQHSGSFWEQYSGT